MEVRLQTAPFDPGDLLSVFCAERRETGAVVSFTGLARADGGTTTTLWLEAYPGFTDLEIERLGRGTIARFSLQDLLVVHRIGAIEPGAPIVFVAAAAAQRRFEAVDQLMDYLKSRAPFWKKQSGPDGECWIEPTARDVADAARWD